jgi:hypothetical protein
MFSGGEAFRINFALRVALSKMLARRAGAPLQTLFLDEGFGTQDPRGREAIIDAINAIADDFRLILIITHIEELKDAVPDAHRDRQGHGRLHLFRRLIPMPPSRQTPLVVYVDVDDTLVRSVGTKRIRFRRWCSMSAT